MILPLICCLFSAELPVRTWKAESGQTAEGTFLDRDGDEVRLRLENDKTVAVPFSGLVEEDRNYIRIVTEDYSEGSIPLTLDASREMDYAIGRAAKSDEKITAEYGKARVYKNSDRRSELRSISVSSKLFFYATMKEVETFANGRTLKFQHNWAFTASFDPGRREPSLTGFYAGMTVKTLEPMPLKGFWIPSERFLVRDDKGWSAVADEEVLQTALRDLQTDVRVAPSNERPRDNLKPHVDYDNKRTRDGAVAVLTMLGPKAQVALPELIRYRDEEVKGFSTGSLEKAIDAISSR